MAADGQSGQVAFAEAKWSNVSGRDARKTLRALEEKSREFEWRIGRREERSCLLARKVGGKEALARDGYLVWDAEDLERWSSER